MTIPTPNITPEQDGAVIRKLVRGGKWAFLGKMATYPLGLILTMLLAKLLSTAEVGGYFLVMSLVMISSGLVQAGLATTMCKMIARSLATDNPHAVKQIIRIGAIALLVTGALAIILLTNQPGHWLLSKLENGEYLHGTLSWIAAMVVTFAAVGLCCEILRGFHKLSYAAILDQQLLQRLLLLCALIVPLTFSIQIALINVFQITTISAFLSALLGFFLITRTLAPLGNYGTPTQTIEVLREAPTFLLIRVNNWILNSAAVWILGMTRPLEEIGLYGTANVIALLVLAPWQVITAAASPTVVALHTNNNKAALESVLRTAALIAAVAATLGCLILILFGKDILSILFTSEYAAGSAVLVILAIGRGISTFLGSPAMLLSMTHHQQAVMRVLLLTSTVTLIGYIFAAETYGAIGVATVTAISAIFQGILLAIIAHRALRVITLPCISIKDWQQFMQHFKR